MTVPTRIAVVAVGDPARHDEGLGRSVLARLRERAAGRPLPPGTVLAECADPDPGRLVRLWDQAGLAVVLESAPARDGDPGRIYRLDLPGAELRRPGTMGGHGLGEAVELGRALDRLPGHLVAYAVAAADTSAGEGLSAPVASAVGLLAERVEEEIVRHRVAAARQNQSR
ncbi:hydrogenase maturation protease [Streptomyces sp. NPDC096152]|uniref:hydrogenase maturation protease n=1 Tax=Streptomyces sp. NPDC096152 TaxID=3366078 RepID=UPI00380404CF